MGDDDDPDHDANIRGNASHSNDQVQRQLNQQNTRQQQQQQQDKIFDFSNPHVIADLMSVAERARAALLCGSRVAFEMQSLGGVLMQVLLPSHCLYNLVSLPSENPPHLSIAFMIMNTKSVPFMQAAYLAAASHFNSCFSASKLAASMCKRVCNNICVRKINDTVV